MASRKFHFFADANPQASSGSAYLNVQNATGAFGPVTTNQPNYDQYRVTSVHTATGFDPTAYAVCDGMICVQKVDATHVNIVLKPLVQPPLNFAPIKYIIYKGILAASLIAGNDVVPATSNRLAKVIQETQTRKNTSAGGTPQTAPKEALGIGLTGAGFLDTDPIDNLFFRTAVSFQPPNVDGGWTLGQFDRTGFGLEILMEGLGLHHPLSRAREIESRISVEELVAGANEAQIFDHWHDKEQVLGYMDPCAFYGSFFRAGVAAKTSTATAFTDKTQAALHNDVLYAFENRKKVYLDIRNEHNFSFNYFRNYGTAIRLSTKTAPVDYYASGWPILTLAAADLAAGNTTTARNAFGLQLPVGDNPKPLIFVSQGYRDINRKGAAFPAELKNAERFFDAFDIPAGGYTVSKKASGPSSLTLAVPNISGLASTTPVSCYVRLKYLKQEQGATTASTVIQSANYLDNLIWPLDLKLLFSGGATIKTGVFDEEIYVNALGVSGLRYDFIGKVGIARDLNNTTLFLIPSIVREGPTPASTLVSLPAEAGTGSGGYLALIASHYPLERVSQGDLQLTATETVPVADFVSDAGAGGFAAPDFSKLILLVVSNTTLDYWRTAAAQLDSRFRTYLGVTNLQNLTDLDGVAYTSFELVLRGFSYDQTLLGYVVKEVNTDPTILTDNIKIYAHVETKKLEITQLSLLDIDGGALRYLSATPHTYFGGNTRIHGTITVEGESHDALQSLVLEVIQNGNVVATGDLAPNPTATLLHAFGTTERIQLAQAQLLFNLTSAQLGGIDASADGTLGLRVRTTSTSGQQATRDAIQRVQILAQYTGANRYGPRDTADGGDDWIRPSVLALLNQVADVNYGDMANMNGGAFTQHLSHGDGLNVDGKYAGYGARDAACAQTMIDHLNTAAYGSRISMVFVTYSATPANVFYQAIKDVVLSDGRTAVSVIRPVTNHDTHFHWRFVP